MILLLVSAIIKLKIRRRLVPAGRVFAEGSIEMQGVSDQQRTVFEEMPVHRAVATLALPTVISQIILVVYNVADTYFVGQRGDASMVAAVTLCMPAFMFLTAIANLFGVGGASLISRALGAGEEKRACAASAFAFWGCMATVFLYSLATLLFGEGFSGLLGADAQTLPYVRQYLFYVVTVGGLPAAMNSVLAHLVRSEGRAGEASFGMSLGGLLNIALDPLFIFFVFPRGQEVTAVAVATLTSNLAAAVYFLLAMKKHRHMSLLSLRPSLRMLGDQVPREVVTVGLPACLMTFLENLSYVILDNLMAAVGAAALAGIGIAKKLNMLAHSIVRGMSQGTMPLIGYNYASGDHHRMKHSILVTGVASTCFALACTASALLFGSQMTELFIHDPETTRYGANFLHILSLGAPLSACAYTFITFFEATGHKDRALLLAVLRKGALDIPLMYLLRLVIPVYGVVWATPLADGAACVVSLVLFVRFMRTLNHHAAPEHALPAQG